MYVLLTTPTFFSKVVIGPFFLLPGGFLRPFSVGSLGLLPVPTKTKLKLHVGDVGTGAKMMTG